MFECLWGENPLFKKKFQSYTKQHLFTTNESGLGFYTRMTHYSLSADIQLTWHTTFFFLPNVLLLLKAKTRKCLFNKKTFQSVSLTCSVLIWFGKLVQALCVTSIHVKMIKSLCYVRGGFMLGHTEAVSLGTLCSFWRNTHFSHDSFLLT